MKLLLLGFRFLLLPHAHMLKCKSNSIKQWKLMEMITARAGFSGGRVRFVSLVSGAAVVFRQTQMEQKTQSYVSPMLWSNLRPCPEALYENYAPGLQRGHTHKHITVCPHAHAQFVHEIHQRHHSRVHIFNLATKPQLCHR